MTKTNRNIDVWVSYDGKELKRQVIMHKGENDGIERAQADYPHAVYRDRLSVEWIASQIAQEFHNEVTSLYKRYDGSWSFANPHDPERVTTWVENTSEVKRLYSTAFIAGYEEEVAKRDEAARPKVQPQPAATPATPTGATVRVKNVDRDNPNQYVYYLELVDPTYIDGVFEIKDPLVVYFEGAAAPETPTPTQLSSYGASSTTPGRTTAGSSYAAYEATSKPPQRPRKPHGSYWKKQ